VDTGKFQSSEAVGLHIVLNSSAAELPAVEHYTVSCTLLCTHSHRIIPTAVLMQGALVEITKPWHQSSGSLHYKYT